MVKAGDRVGAYEIVAPLGAGGMGVLFRARDPRLNRDVAIKFLADKHAASDERLKRFEREARAASALNHPHIITVYEIGEHEGRPFIAMELVEGRSLRALLGEGASSMRRLLTIASQIADGLAAAHERGIVHRDLKPENVMIAKNGYVKILDFGLAKLEPEAVSAEEDTARLELVTTPGLVMGTAAYMSPEQARGLAIDHRSDQFSLGTMLYGMLTATRPFEGASPIDLVHAIVYREPEKVTSLNPRVPAAIEWIVERCLRKDREDRYDSTGDLARELELARDRMSDATPSVPLGPVANARERSRWALAVVVAACLAVAAGAWITMREGARPQASAAGRGNATIYLAVQPFKDVSPEPLSPALGEGFAQTISARLGTSKSVRLMNALGVDIPSRNADDPRVICRETGANRLLRGSLQRSGDTLRVTWAIVDTAGVQIAGDAMEGAYRDLFVIQDRLVGQVMEHLGTQALPAKSVPAGSFHQDRYLEAVGHLVRNENPASVDEAIEILSSLGDSPIVLAALARAYLAKRIIAGDSRFGTLAMETSQRALASGERSAEIYSTLGEVNALLGKHEAAIEAFRAALSMQPDYADAMIGLASSLDSSGKDAESEAAYRAVIALRPALWIGHNHLGVFFLVRGRYAESVKSFESALTLTPDNVRVLNNLGAAYQQMGRHEDALEIYSRSLAERPNAVAYSNRGVCLYFMERYEESAEAFERATALTPESWILWVNLGDAYRWSSTQTASAPGAYRRAVDLGEKELALHPRDGNTLAMLATSYAKLGDARRARNLATMAIGVAENDAYALYAAGVALEVTGERDRAVSILLQALDRGYSVEELRRDPELSELRRHPTMAKALDQPKQKREGA
ncbi:MAG: protein kinase [Acidobacteria bacterium]|nr:protein kinase [Acidobacteriota bacterium]